MAYSTTTDYKAIQNALKTQIDAETDPAKKAALQAQWNEAEQSRTEKIASDLQKYGKYATDSELDSAAGIQAQNQIGNQYETQARNINTAYDTYKQNANNDALSRGMARSTFVSDRLANLDVQRGTALTDNETAKIAAIQNAKTNIIDNYRTNTANALTAEKNEFADNKMTYYNDYQAEINNVLGDGDPTNDWKADKLNAWRNEKLLEQQAAALKAAKSTSDGGGGKPKLTAAQALEAYKDPTMRTPEVISAYKYYYGEPAGTPTYSTPRTATYGSQTVSDVNDMLNNGYTQQEVMAAAKQQYGVNSKEYKDIVSAVLRR